MRRGHLLERPGMLANPLGVHSAVGAAVPDLLLPFFSPLLADPTENICKKAASGALEDVHLPTSATARASIPQNPLEKERETARKREQERRRREAVSVCVNVAALRLV